MTALPIRIQGEAYLKIENDLIRDAGQKLCSAADRIEKHDDHYEQAGGDTINEAAAKLLDQLKDKP